MLTAQFSALTILFSLSGWFIGHQASHCAAYQAGKVELSHPVAFIMGLETFLGLIFLAWFAYMDGIPHAAGLLALSFVVRLALVKLETVSGLTQKAWAISLSGVVVVPALLISLVMLVLHPISNAGLHVAQHFTSARGLTDEEIGIPPFDSLPDAPKYEGQDFDTLVRRQARH